MPSVVKSRNWFVRVTAPWEYIEGKLSGVKEKIWYSGMLVGYHHGDKAGAPHAHLCLKTLVDLQKQSLDVALKSVFGLVNKSTYSSKPWDGKKEAMAYLYHDENGRVDNHMGLSEEEINELRRTCDAVQALVKVAKERSSHKVIDYVIERYKDHWERLDIGRCILLAVREGLFHHPGSFMLERYILEIELRVAQPHTVENVIDAQLRLLKSFQ